MGVGGRMEVEGKKKGEKKEYNLALGRKGTYEIAISNRQKTGLQLSSFKISVSSERAVRCKPALKALHGEGVVELI